jgi:hypothetical protein
MKALGDGYYEHEGKLFREDHDHPRRVCPECGTGFWPLPYKNKLYDTYRCAHKAAARAYRDRQKKARTHGGS